MLKLRAMQQTHQQQVLDGTATTILPQLYSRTDKTRPKAKSGCWGLGVIITLCTRRKLRPADYVDNQAFFHCRPAQIPCQVKRDDSDVPILL